MAKDVGTQGRGKATEIIEGAFWQLCVVYTLLIALISINFIERYTLHFEFFALILGLLGLSLVWGDNSYDSYGPHGKTRSRESTQERYIWNGILVLGGILVILTRAIPYIRQYTAGGRIIPLGYDTGIYKYGIESFATKGFMVESWVKGALEPGFLYLTRVCLFFISSTSILVYGMIAACLALAAGLYFFGSVYYDRRVGILAVVLYGISVIQFKVFSFMYFKNIAALALMLFALVFYKKEKYALFVLFGACVGLMHRPTFYIFGLSMMAYTAIHYKEWKRNVLLGIMILGITALGYIGFYQDAILPLVKPVAESFISPGSAPGTFVNFFTYQFSTLAYLPFAIFGFIIAVRQKKYDMLMLWTIVCAAIVYFQFFFFNRFIIHLDIGLIIFASVGFVRLLDEKKKWGILIVGVLLLCGSILIIGQSLQAMPLISSGQLDFIATISSHTEHNAHIMILSREYSPWVLAYSGRNVIAPGLFDENKWNKDEWDAFWQGTNIEETHALMSQYSSGEPVYLYTGTAIFNNPCFTIVEENDYGRLYAYSAQCGETQ